MLHCSAKWQKVKFKIYELGGYILGENIFCEVRADRKFISIILQWQCMLKIHKNKSKGITGKDMPFLVFFSLFCTNLWSESVKICFETVLQFFERNNVSRY